MRHFALPALLAFSSALAAANCATAPLAADRFPKWNPGTTYAAEVKKALGAFTEKPLPWWTYVAPKGYTWNGDYLGSSNQPVVANWSTMKPDESGIPIVKYGEEWVRNPITITQDALRYYGRFLDKGQEADKAMFLKEADAVLAQQDAQGGIRFPFEWRYFRNFEPYKSGWVSGMAQGQALSMYARAYDLTKEAKYLNAGRTAFEFMVKPVSQGGTRSDLGNLHPSLARYVWFEEYLPDSRTKPNHVLNGYLFGTLGLYDWSQVDKTSVGQSAGEYFKCAAFSAKQTRALFDVGGFTSYDLGHLSKEGEMQLAGKPHIDQPYQGVHIYLALALYDITRDPAFLNAARLWNKQVGTPQPIPR